MWYARNNDASGVLPASISLRVSRLFLLLLLSAICCCVAVIYASEATSNDPSWDEIEAWALGETSQPPSDLKKSNDKKTLLTPSARANQRKTEPKLSREITDKYLQYAQKQIIKQDAARDWQKAYDYAYRIEQYDQALNYLGRMISDQKQWKQTTQGIWFKQKLWETAILANKQPSREILEKFFNDWKEQLLADIEAPKPYADQNWVKNDQKQRLNELAKSEAYFQSFPTLRADLAQLENDGEDNPKVLWELCVRFGEKRPYAPLHYARALYKLREWHPDFEHVTNGNAQCRLMDCLFNELSSSLPSLHKEAGDEAAILIDKYPAHHRVTSGDALWILANNRFRQPYPFKSNKEMVAILTEVKKLYEKFRENYPKHWANHPQGAFPSLWQDRMRELERKIKQND